MMKKTAKEVIESIYQEINNRDIETAIEWVDDDCLYQDVNFSQAFEGKDAVKSLFQESCENVPDDLKFVIDEITTGDPLKVGVLWHVELDNIPIPNGRGVSFYRISEITGKLIFARDIVEPPIKPGKASFFIIRLVTPLIRRFLKQDSAPKKTQPILSICLCCFQEPIFISYSVPPLIIFYLENLFGQYNQKLLKKLSMNLSTFSLFYPF